MARTAGLEPAAFGSVDRRSNPTELRAQQEESIPEKGAPGELGVRRPAGVRHATSSSSAREEKRLAEKPGFEPGKEC